MLGPLGSLGRSLLWHVPELHDAIHAGSRNPGSTVGESHEMDPPLMACQRGDLLMAGDAPETHDIVQARRDRTRQRQGD